MVSEKIVGIEIERKYLVVADNLPELDAGKPIRQGYVKTESAAAVRVRIKGGKGYLTIKGPASGNYQGRPEFEYEISAEEAGTIIDDICDGGTVEKTRYEVYYDGFLWELDFFGGRNMGLILAEVELPDFDTVPALADWVGREVTGDLRYYNMNLAVNPWPSWNTDS